RCRQYRPLPEQHSLRRSWCAAGPADRRCQRALRQPAGPARRIARQPAHAGRPRLPRTRAVGRWELVRPVGGELHLGTWSVLGGLNGAVVAPRPPSSAPAADWLVAIQNSDGGWGEDCSSYRLDYRGHEPAPSNASQTAWALLGLMAAGRVDHPAVARGIAYLQ